MEEGQKQPCGFCCDQLLFLEQSANCGSSVGNVSWQRSLRCLFLNAATLRPSV